MKEIHLRKIGDAPEPRKTRSSATIREKRNGAHSANGRPSKFGRGESLRKQPEPIQPTVAELERLEKAREATREGERSSKASRWEGERKRVSTRGIASRVFWAAQRAVQIWTQHSAPPLHCSFGYVELYLGMQRDAKGADKYPQNFIWISDIRLFIRIRI